MKRCILAVLGASAFVVFANTTSAAEIKNLESGKCIDASGASIENGTPIIQFDCHGGSNQHWKLTSEGTIYGYGNKCLDVINGSITRGAGVQLWDCHGGSNQKWYLRDGQIIGVGSKKCLEVTDMSLDNVAAIRIWSCNGQPNQKWNIY